MGGLSLMFGNLIMVIAALCQSMGFKLRVNGCGLEEQVLLIAVETKLCAQ